MPEETNDVYVLTWGMKIGWLVQCNSIRRLNLRRHLPVVSGLAISFENRRHQIRFIWTRNPVWILCLLLLKFGTLSVSPFFLGALRAPGDSRSRIYMCLLLLKFRSLSVFAFFLGALRAPWRVRCEDIEFDVEFDIVIDMCSMLDVRCSMLDIDIVVAVDVDIVIDADAELCSIMLSICARYSNAGARKRLRHGFVHVLLYVYNAYV